MLLTTDVDVDIFRMLETLTINHKHGQAELSLTYMAPIPPRLPARLARPRAFPRLARPSRASAPSASLTFHTFPPPIRSRLDRSPAPLPPRWPPASPRFPPLRSPPALYLVRLLDLLVFHANYDCYRFTLVNYLDCVISRFYLSRIRRVYKISMNSRPKNRNSVEILYSPPKRSMVDPHI